jgi:hypothetical protein
MSKHDLWALAIVWWALGTSFILWLSRGSDLTWGRLLLCLVFGVFGPGIWGIILFSILVNAEFWDKPIFSRKPKNE